MRVLVGALLAALGMGSQPPASGNLAVTLEARTEKTRCSVVSTATIVTYDALRSREVAFRFVRSDGSVSPIQRLAFAGEGAIAQSVRDRWISHGAKPWVALEVVSPERFRSPRAAVPRCAPGELAVRR